MTGKLSVVGLGPGNPHQLTPEAQEVVRTADDLFGYGPYLDRIPALPTQRRHASDNRQELQRAAEALKAATEGRIVAVVSGGDPGVFGMAAAVCEALENGPPEWRQVEVAIIPGVSAMLAVAARIGAPLGHDFCAISLSDNLKPWPVIEQRLELAATAGFVIALYNPISRARPWQLDRAFDKLRTVLPETTPVVFGRAAGRPDERIAVTRLSAARGSDADMATCIIVGSAETRLIERPGNTPLVYTPRGSSRPAA
ncbi:MAG: precorrin-3B C(17)-methyltransferase [Proteobacteria bacterium]|nr:precorrin-3B C(17)-methyltransferase [Pseudomonadota bacterium]